MIYFPQLVLNETQGSHVPKALRLHQESLSPETGMQEVVFHQQVFQLKFQNPTRQGVKQISFQVQVDKASENLKKRHSTVYAFIRSIWSIVLSDAQVWGNKIILAWKFYRQRSWQSPSFQPTPRSNCCHFH